MTFIYTYEAGCVYEQKAHVEYMSMYIVGMVDGRGYNMMANKNTSSWHL